MGAGMMMVKGERPPRRHRTFKEKRMQEQNDAQRREECPRAIKREPGLQEDDGYNYEQDYAGCL